ncbi:hypothetical protein [Loigolactobacillus coryniformis]|uniref:Uncharacterized protein n=1 Tax=Loigolactobacillus coryniformis TaxID=1610 RepID=A0A5B8TGG3_9LACO|nr:hypothetical protein [Loigolactobacillus coryniformis]QEA53002.1 hypothetical protein FGL77_06595 [Loigolactobacillus coryniformis]RRG02910.1 MAG: hypothetical protein DUD28_10310 [Lactobacillus sp.]
MKVNQMVQQNEQLRQQLTAVNRRYYENILLYMRGHSWMKRDRDVEATLLDILNDMIAAQENGQNAADYFGKEPQQIVRDILKVLPNDFLASIKLVGYMLLVYSSYYLLPLMIDVDRAFDVGNILIMGSITIVIVIVWILMASTLIYQVQTWLTIFVHGLIVVATITVVVLSAFLETNLKVHLTGYSGIGVIVLLLLLVTGILIHEKGSIVYFPVYLMVIVQALLGIMVRLPLPWLHNFLTQQVDAKLFSLGLTVVAGSIGVGAIFWNKWCKKV